MKKLFLSISLLLFAFTMSAQVGIGTENPNESAALEIKSADHGVLIPRVSLQSATDETTIAHGNVNSLLVFNTAATNDLTPGYYYWYQDSWHKLAILDEVSQLQQTLTTITIDVEAGTVTYTDENDQDTVLDIADLVEAHQTTTLLKDHGNGAYTYYNEAAIDDQGNPIAGEGVSLNIPDAVTQNIENQGDIANAIINLVQEQFGNVYYNPDEDQFFYIDDNSTMQPLSLNEGGNSIANVSFTIVDDSLSVNDSAGNSVRLALTDIANNATFINVMNNNIPKENLVLGSGLEFYGLNLGQNALFKQSKIRIAQHGVTLDKINPGAPDQVLTTNTNGEVDWENAADFVADHETLTSLSYFNGNLFYVAEDGETTQLAINSNTTNTSPWLLQGTASPAANNTDNIYHSGTVSIGTSGIPDSLATVQLFVDGDIAGSGAVYSVTTGYPDYVFADYFTGHSSLNPHYHFLNLHQVKSFIKKHHHLPGIQPITKLYHTKKGYRFNMTHLSVQLLEKTEELYLHTIDQQKQIDRLKEQNTSLKKENNVLRKQIEENAKRLKKIEAKLFGDQKPANPQPQP